MQQSLGVSSLADDERTYRPVRLDGLLGYRSSRWDEGVSAGATRSPRSAALRDAPTSPLPHWEPVSSVPLDDLFDPFSDTLGRLSELEHAELDRPQRRASPPLGPPARAVNAGQAARPATARGSGPSSMRIVSNDPAMVEAMSGTDPAVAAALMT